VIAKLISPKMQTEKEKEESEKKDKIEKNNL
jgi:hypothetical protein